ncbi:unnamed protein product [Lactuca virosa]|uniref:Uncharacterized protein n=1 Tax=Lactuca virosa TaxID=75947 RepID=A0AAU9MIC4_9ASTR|nr:unnamed protein product [Lactuca virosa]
MHAAKSPCHNKSFEDHHHITANGSNGAKPEDVSITLLQVQLNVYLIRDKVNGDLYQFRYSLRREMDEMNRLVHDVRKGQLDMSHMIKTL